MTSTTDKCLTIATKCNIQCQIGLRSGSATVLSCFCPTDVEVKFWFQSGFCYLLYFGNNTVVLEKLKDEVWDLNDIA